MISKLVDQVLEFPVVTSFSKIGYQARRLSGGWTDLDGYDLDGQVVLLTGGTSGLGAAAARQLAACGATVVITGRNAERTAEAASRIGEAADGAVLAEAADMGDFDQVRALADRVGSTHERLDVLIHNAGALTADRRVAPSGIEATVASQVVGPFLLTALLLDRLAESAPARVLTMSSGGMLSAALSVANLEMDEKAYRGAEQYARAKRAQVTLNEIWAERHDDRGVRFHSVHPGWADTPGVTESLPVFARVAGPLLRSPEEGADTLVWLAADDGEPLETNGLFWHDRRPRRIHRLPHTRPSDTPERRARLWDWVTDQADIGR